MGLLAAGFVASKQSLKKSEIISENL